MMITPSRVRFTTVKRSPRPQLLGNAPSPITRAESFGKYWRFQPKKASEGESGTGATKPFIFAREVDDPGVGIL
jgi:hypothetical protein